jgi:hypothetical protein
MGVKWQGLEANHSPSSSAGIKNDGAITPLPLRLHGVVLDSLSTGTNSFLPVLN